MTNYDLDLVRSLIQRRRMEAQAAQGERAALKASTSTRVDSQYVVVRCDKEHRRGGHPKLGEIHQATRGRALVVSRIAWLPGDQSRLPPWEREAYLGTAAPQPLDDQLLADWLLHLDDWEGGTLPIGERWLKKMPTFELVSLIAPNVDPLITPWVRCAEHRDDARPLTRKEVFERLREVTTV